MNLIEKLHSFKVSVNLPVSVITIVTALFVAYGIWQGYWYQKVALEIIKWHAHFAIYGFAWLLGYYLLWAFAKTRYAEKANNYFLVFSSVVVSLLVVEFLLQLTGFASTYLEKVSGYYNSPYRVTDKGLYHVWNNPKEHWIIKPEYKYSRPTNRWGLPDVDWPVNKKPNEKRILALGDSFTEGDGAPDDSDYVAILSQRLNTTGGGYYLMNAGVLGSDPFFNYIQLKDQLLRYKPDFILQTLSSQDITADIKMRGGMERFQKNGTLKFTSAPWWEPVYALSYISRLFFKALGYSELLKREKLTAADKEKLNKQTVELFKNYQALCNEKGIRLYVLLRPDRYEIEQNKYQYDIASIAKESGVETVDMLPLYNTYIEKNKAKPTDYFWSLDGHHNSKGYQMMADVLFESLSPVLTDSLSSAATIKN
ncbi:MAG: hypothetical protein KA149_00765 [Chitinophagales bacterium]|nr:hypothetical protein [Chitinophagales bacterium]